MSNYKIEIDGAKKTIIAYYNSLFFLQHLFNLDFNKTALLLDKPLRPKIKEYKINPNMEQYTQDFVNKLETKFSVSQLNLLKHNLRNLKITNYINIGLLIRHPYYSLTGRIGGYYDLFNNKLYISPRISNNSLKNHAINHEHFHLASTNSYSNQSFSGFAHFAATPLFRPLPIGVALNEGCTEHLVTDTFGTTNIGRQYYCLKECVDVIAKVIGKEKLYNYYFHSNLKDLRKDLAKYTSISTTNAFIYDLDIFLFSGLKISEITDYLDLLYRAKLKEELDNDIIDYNFALDEIDYKNNKINKIKTISKIKNRNQYLEVMKQFQPKEVEDIQYDIERRKQKRLFKIKDNF